MHNFEPLEARERRFGQVWERWTSDLSKEGFGYFQVICSAESLYYLSLNHSLFPAYLALIIQQKMFWFPRSREQEKIDL